MKTKSSVTIYDSSGNEIRRIDFDMEVSSNKFSCVDTTNWVPAQDHPCVNRPDISGMLLSLARKAEQRRLLARICRYGAN